MGLVQKIQAHVLVMQAAGEVFVQYAEEVRPQEGDSLTQLRSRAVALGMFTTPAKNKYEDAVDVAVAYGAEGKAAYNQLLKMGEASQAVTVQFLAKSKAAQAAGDMVKAREYQASAEEAFAQSEEAFTAADSLYGYLVMNLDAVQHMQVQYRVLIQAAEQLLAATTGALAALERVDKRELTTLQKLLKILESAFENGGKLVSYGVVGVGLYAAYKLLKGNKRG